MVEAFLSHTSQEALADGIGTGCMNRRLEQFDAAGCRHPSKARPKFAVVITNEIFRCLPIGDCVSERLCHPGISRESCHNHMDHPSGFQFYDEEGEEWPKEEIGHL